MFQAVWDVMANYGMDLQKIADWFAGLFGEEGKLAPLADIPVLGDIINAVAGLAPVVGDIG